jgi:hypothetical protein
MILRDPDFMIAISLMALVTVLAALAIVFAHIL